MSQGAVRTAEPRAGRAGAGPLSIVQVVTCRGWSSDAWAAMGLALGLQDEGHRVLMVCRDVEGGRRVAERMRGEGVREVDFIEASNNFRPLSYLRDLAKLRDLVRTRSVDVIHVHRGVEHWLVTSAWPFRGGPVVVRSRHILRPVRGSVFNTWLYTRGTDRTVAVCERIRRGYLEGNGYPAGAFVTVMGGVDASAYDPDDRGDAFRSEWGIPRDAWVIGVAGGIRLWLKGQDVLLRALARLPVNGGGPPPWVVVMGEGEDVDELRGLARDLGLADRLVLPGYLKSLAGALAACDALAFSSRRSEGTSRVLFDYLASGRPVAAARVGCVDEIVRDGVEGYLVPPEDEEALARALDRLRSDPEAARAMGRSGHRRAVEEFDRRAIARRMVDIYMEAARSRRQTA